MNYEDWLIYKEMKTRVCDNENCRALMVRVLHGETERYVCRACGLEVNVKEGRIDKYRFESVKNKGGKRGE
jgi:DNA-directed RNA polymerase subunit M/transcription elongation factor TFIIS